MSAPVTDLWHILIGAGIALDDDEAAALGAPGGETISLWAATANRHGVPLAHVICLALYLVQFRHCRDQIVGVPMAPSNYVRAVVLLILFAPAIFVIGAMRRAWRWLTKNPRQPH